MGIGYKELDVLLYRLQTTFGTPITALTIADSTAVMDGFELTYTPEFTPMDLATARFGQERQVRGGASVEVKVEMPIAPTGTTVASNVSEFLRASGMSEAVSTNLRTYAPISDTTGTSWNQMTLWGYIGDKAAGDSVRTKAQNVMFDWELTGEIGKPCTMTFTGKGSTDAAPDATTYPAGTVTIPNSIIPATIKSTAMTVGGKTLSLLSFGVSMGNTVTLVKDMSSNYGYAGATITKRESNWKAKAYAATASTQNPFPVMDSTSSTALTNFGITFGPAVGSRITIASGTSKCQITKVTPSDEDGIHCWDLEGIFVDNDFTVAVNVT
jgi:hypothetical protein